MGPTEEERTFASTTWRYERVKIASPPEARGSARRSRTTSGFYRLPPWNWRRKPLHLTVKYRGGPACWFEIHARGEVLRVTGDRALYDVIRHICQQE